MDESATDLISFEATTDDIVQFWIRERQAGSTLNLRAASFISFGLAGEPTCSISGSVSDELDLIRVQDRLTGAFFGLRGYALAQLRICEHFFQLFLDQ